ncbi:MAG: metallophosphoesterase [Spirochaetales bacterium]|nr:metallophosphoesterase [Spirochaetales bacterium]
MKIGLLSDLHVDINFAGEDRVTPAVCDTIKNNDLDLFITAGDIASDHKLSLEVVTRIEKETGRDCLFVPGNHDLWNEKHPGISAMETYTAMAAHPHNLASGPVKLKNGWSAVGDTCWYDYSFGTGSVFSFEDFQRRSYKGRIWQDSIMTDWKMPDKKVHDWFLGRVEESLILSEGDEIVAVTHMLPIDDFTVPVPHDTWDYFNAFLGSRSLGELFLKYPSVKYSICGHVHYRKQVVKGGITNICQCLGYSTEWFDNVDPFVEVSKTMKIIEI